MKFKKVIFTPFQLWHWWFGFPKRKVNDLKFLFAFIGFFLAFILLIYILSIVENYQQFQSIESENIYIFLVHGLFISGIIFLQFFAFRILQKTSNEPLTSHPVLNWINYILSIYLFVTGIIGIIILIDSIALIIFLIGFIVMIIIVMIFVLIWLLTVSMFPIKKATSEIWDKVSLPLQFIKYQQEFFESLPISDELKKILVLSILGFVTLTPIIFSIYVIWKRKTLQNV